MPPATASQTHRQMAVKIDGVDEGKLLLRRWSYREELGRPFQLSVTVEPRGKHFTSTELLGKLLVVRLTTRGTRARHFAGYIARALIPGQRAGVPSEIELTVVPRLWTLALRSDCRIYEKNKTVLETISTVLSEHGVHVRNDCRGTYAQREFTVQYRESDLNFVSRMMEQYGIYYRAEHAENGEGIVLCDDTACQVPIPGMDSIPYYPPDQQVGGDAVLSWSVENAVQTAVASLKDFDFKRPTTDLFADDRLSHPHTASTSGLGDHTFSYEYPGEYVDRAEGLRLAKARAEELSASSVVFRAETSCRVLSPGQRFTLTDPTNGLDPAHAGKAYQITSIAMDGEADAYDTGGSGSGSWVTCSFRATPDTYAFRPARLAPKPVIAGAQTAIVVGPENTEIHTDEHGRIKVKFHWDRYGDASKGDTSCWMRVAQGWAGAGWGAMQIPRVGHEVIVEFLEGDPDQPIVTGRVYHGQNRPPYALPEHKTISTIKSNSSAQAKGFNELRFEDKKGAEQVFLHAQLRMDHVVRASLYEKIGGNREIRVGYDKKGDFNLYVEKDINQHLVGGQYELVDKKLNQNVKDDVVEVYESNQTTVAYNRMTLNAFELVAETNDTISLKSGKIVAQGAQSVNLKAGAIKIEGTMNISLKCGGSFISLTPSGVFVSGPMVFLNTGGAAQPAEAPLKAEDPTLETPLDAASATTATPGSHGGGGGSYVPPTRTSTKISLWRAPEPPPPPPDRPRTPPPPGVDRKFVDIQWVEKETYCGGPATLQGTTKNYTDNTTENAEVRNVVDGATVVGVPITISGNSYNQNVEVKDWLPRKSGANYETERDEDAFAAGQKTPKALKMKFIPNLDRTPCAINNSQFSMVVDNYVAEVGGTIQYVKGFMAWLIQLGDHVPADTGGQAGVNWGAQVAGSFSGSDWRFAKDDTTSATGLVYWNGSAWTEVPATWSDTGNVKLYGIGIWREGTSNKAQFGNSWPDNIPNWGAPQNTIASGTLPNWIINTNNAWSDKFDLRRHGCVSTDTSCCRYAVKISVSFSAVATRTAHVIVLAANNGRSNAGAWSLGDTRPGLAPHEFGHHLNCPDEYVGGVGIDTSVNTDGATAGIDSSSMMGNVPGDSMMPVKARHFKTISQHLTDMIQKQKGVAWTFDTIAHA